MVDELILISKSLNFFKCVDAVFRKRLITFTYVQMQLNCSLRLSATLQSTFKFKEIIAGHGG
jgi:hypothetical protein